MKWLVYGAVIAAALLVPVERTDVGKLQPIEAVAIYIEDNQILLKTELGDMGEGQTVTEALDNLKHTTAGIVYLDTAEYLLLSEGAQAHIEEISRYLKGDVRICMIQPDVPLEDAAPYLDIHKPEVRLDEWNGDTIREELAYRDERFALLKKE